VSVRILLVVALLAGPAVARGDDDPWLGPDKALHFSVSAAIAGAGYGAGAALDQERPWRFLIGGALGVGAGVGKELLDLAGAGQPSWRDLAWDALGITTGLLLAYAFDRLFSDGPVVDGDRTGQRDAHQMIDPLVREL